MQHVWPIALALTALGSAGATLPRDGFDLHYRVYGSGKPVLILSGGPGFDCDYLEPVARDVAKTNQAILVELRGTGRSLPPSINERTVNLQLYLSDLDDLRTHLKYESWIILGHSAGAVLAMNYAALHPDRVESLVLVDSGPIRFESASVIPDNVNLRLTAEDRAAAQKNPSLQTMLPGYFYDRAKALEAAPAFPEKSFHAEIGRLLAAGEMAPGMDLRPALKTFDRPVLVIAGRQDPLDPAVQYEIHLALKNSNLVLLDRCGHFAWLEQPAAFYKAVHDFLAR